MFGWVLRPVFFYPLAALAAAGTILASMNYALVPHETAPQGGQTQEGVLVFSAAALQHVDVGSAQEYYLQRAPNGAPSSIQIATKKAYSTPGPSDVGVRLLLSPQAAAGLAGKPLRVDLQLRPLLYTTAPRLSVSAQTQGAPSAWVVQPFPSTAIERFSTDAAKTAVWVSYALPATESAPTAIGLWPEADRQGGEQADLNVGVEIVQIRIAPGA